MKMRLFCVMVGVSASILCAVHLEKKDHIKYVRQTVDGSLTTLFGEVCESGGYFREYAVSYNASNNAYSGLYQYTSDETHLTYKKLSVDAARKYYELFSQQKAHKKSWVDAIIIVRWLR